jgi:hydroxyethylthiazole kinase-like uncharacterized protein yjeF
VSAGPRQENPRHPETDERCDSAPLRRSFHMRLVSAEEMRRLDRLTIERYGTPGHVLMERAGTGATKILLEVFPFLRRRGRRVVVVAGKGNNGGDGLVMARLLCRRGLQAEVVLLGRATELGGDAERNLRAYTRVRRSVSEVSSTQKLGMLADRLAKADAVVDAIFGTGLGSPVRGFHAEAIELMNASGVPMFAVDVPSGLNADTGQPLGSVVQAEATATFGCAKIGHVLFPGARLTGTLAVVDIGIADEALADVPAQTFLLDTAAAAQLVPDREADAHKGSCGHVLVIAGGFGKTGAAQLVTRAASRAGAGLVTLAGPASLYTVYAAGVLEAMTETLPDRDGRIVFDEHCLRRLLEGKNALVVGPGIGVNDDTRKTVRFLVEQGRMPAVLDADALSCLSGDTDVLARAQGPLLLTPHPGEMARLLGTDTIEVQGDRVETARRFATHHRCILILKGARTVIADSGGLVWINPTGNPGMASGGMGDVLSGILGGLLAQGLRPNDAARLGVYVHGASADRAAADTGEIGLLASDVVTGLPRELRLLRQCRDV